MRSFLITATHADTDGSGDYDEYVVDISPTNTDDFFQILEIAPLAGPGQADCTVTYVSSASAQSA